MTIAVFLESVILMINFNNIYSYYKDSPFQLDSVLGIKGA